MIIELISLILLVLIAGSVLWLIGNIILFLLTLLAFSIIGIFIWPFVVYFIGFIFSNWIIFGIIIILLVLFLKKRRF
ncbi:hypothetical protein [Cetobacterium sp. SF1]|uniref:hypothetical protein n=1 Tax=unclassified Cetobacterium TaxID=2630983 RepID=UPI003CF1AA38